MGGIRACGGHASVDEVLQNFEGAGCERNVAVRVKRSWVTIALDDRDFQTDGTTVRRRTRLKKESRR